MIDLEQIKKNKSKFLTTVFLSVLAAILLSISIGFSALNQNLNIAGDIDYEQYSPILYNILKREASIGTYAREYESEHQDSPSGTGTKDIYYWRASSTTSANEILDKWNVIFGGFCWQMFRTTDTGGVKMIYNGVPTDGKCNKTGSSATIGNYAFNTPANSIARAGYMYNSTPGWSSKSVNLNKPVYKATISTSWYYADSVAYSSYYSLIDPYKISSSEEYSDFLNKYTLKSSSPTALSTTVYYIIKISENYFYYVSLYDGSPVEDNNQYYTYGSNYTDNGNGTYTITNPTTIRKFEYPDHFEDLANKYICYDTTATATCSELWYLVNVTDTETWYFKVSDKFKYAQGFTYENGMYILNDDSLTTFDFYTNISDIDYHHYTCFNETGECTTLYYVAHYDDNTIYYMDMTGGKSITDVLNDCFYNDSVNQTNSRAKAIVENWYRNNLLDFTPYIDDVVFCGGRDLQARTGFEPNGGWTSTWINFDVKYTCKRETDQFSLSNPKAQLTYPVGLITQNELYWYGNNNLRNIGVEYWTMTPRSIYKYGPTVAEVYNNGSHTYSRSVSDATPYIRPVIALKANINYLSGDGSKDNPYVVDTNLSS